MHHQPPHQNPEELRNLLLAVIVSMAILAIWQFAFVGPEEARRRAAIEQQSAGAAHIQPGTGVRTPAAAGSEAPGALPGAILSKTDALATTPRVQIDASGLHGSINLSGARLDDITLAHYHVSPDPDASDVTLLAPVGTARPYFAEFGWVGSDPRFALPGPDTLWQADKPVLRSGDAVTLTWTNPQGLIFSIVYTLEKEYLLRVTQSVRNSSVENVTLVPYGRIQRSQPPHLEQMVISHEGPIGVFSDTLEEYSYSGLQDDGPAEFRTDKGWYGISDKYWLSAIVPPQENGFSSHFRAIPLAEGNRYQVDHLGTAVTLPPGATADVRQYLYAGPKEVERLERYGDMLDIPLFDRAVDFGILYFLTKPIFHALSYLHGITANFGLAILILTVGLRLLMFPLANKSYLAMGKMRLLQPKVQEIRERHKDDPLKLNQAMMELYKKEKVNPASGCLPILIQLPIFFALYKVLYISIEMRHAPFYGWITDLSAPDPTNVFNLFGLIPWDANAILPAVLHIGVWPIVMMITMVIQQKLNPKPTDPMQEKIITWMPYLFLFLFASFPAGLVIYWAWNNLLSILQQWTIMRRHGAA